MDTAAVVAMTKVSVEWVLKGSQCFLFAAAYCGCFVLSSFCNGRSKFPTFEEIEEIWVSSTTMRRESLASSI